MNRREFLKIPAAAAGAAALPADGMGQGVPVRVVRVRVRRNIRDPRARQDVATLTAAVRRMRAIRNDRNVFSWGYRAAVHGTSQDIPRPLRGIWGQCQHRNELFIWWHRAAMLYFEQIVRLMTRTPGFALPYWDWLEDPSIPEAFLGGPENPLWVDGRRWRRPQLLSRHLTARNWNRFRTMEGNPHGSVHVSVGGVMGVVRTAALDPIFYAHHSMVDRQVEVWRAQTGQRPEISRAIESREFRFAERNRRFRVSDMRNTRALGYVYDDLSAPSQRDRVPSRPRSTAAWSDRGAPRAEIWLAGSMTLRIPYPAMTREYFAAGHWPMVLMLEGVAVTAHGHSVGASFDIYVSLPTDSWGGHDSEDHYVGSIDTFALSAEPQTVSFDLQPMAAELHRKGLWMRDHVIVSFVSDDTGTRPSFRVGRVKVGM